MASVITTAGEKLFTLKAQANEQLDIDTFIFANIPGQDVTAPISRDEAIPSEHVVHQQIVQQVGRINDNVVVYSTVLDSLTGPFEFNWVGLYSSVNDVLVAINHVPTTPKTSTTAGAAGNTLNRNFGIEYSGIAELTGIDVAPETWQLDFTARLAGMDELTRNLAKDLNGVDSFIDDGFKVSMSGAANTFAVLPGVGYANGLRIELTETHMLIADAYPKFVYVDACFDADASSVWSPKVQLRITSEELTDNEDASGKMHYLVKLASITAENQVEDLRELFDFRDDRYGIAFNTINDALSALGQKSESYLNKMEARKAVLHTAVHDQNNGGAKFYIKSGLIADNKNVYEIAGTNRCLVLHDDYYFSEQLGVPVPIKSKVSDIAERNTTESNFRVLGADFVSQINPTWFVVDDDYVYSISKGSYDSSNSHLSKLDIFDISDPSNVKRVSSQNIGIAGVGVRGIAKHGHILYLGSFSTKIYVWNVANPENPFQIRSFDRATASTLQMLHVFNGVLCCPGWDGRIDFYNLNSPETPVLMKSFDLSSNGVSLVQMIKNGNKVWCIGSTTDSPEYSLTCFDLSDHSNPKILSKTAIPEIKYARYGVIENNVLYVGGYAHTSRVCAVDVSTKTPSLIKVFDFNLSSFTKRGNYLIGCNGTDLNDPDNDETVSWDISDIDNPVKKTLLSRRISYPQDLGSYIVCFLNGLGTRLNNSAPNDDNPGAELAIIDFNPLKIDGLKANSIKAKRLNVEQVRSKEIHSDSGTFGAGGVRSSGAMSAPSMSVSNFLGCGILGKGEKGKSLTFGQVTGDITSGIDLFSISVRGENAEMVSLFLANLKLYGIVDQAIGASSKITYEEFIFSGVMNGFSGSFTAHLQPSSITKHEVSSPGNPVFNVGLNVKDGVLVVSVSSSEMNQTESTLFAELETIDHMGRGGKNYLNVDYA
ncbi:phage tail protein [Pseudoalteromonas obscura]|uniref:Phage tail protein n=1 Tax=Pseudoalteromonas obscura TaxID=3048491 RepID=A0ABT7ES63_9GAMM|nr:phage tail protein [Pseudoalteromonas sp. P94(2023)]MDK2597894.1 phage tail protein [Pseudoalteromonas sp. P94(2023)]